MRSLRNGFLAAAAVAAGAFAVMPATSSAAAPAFRPVDHTANSFVLGDGARWAAVWKPPAALRVFDDRLGDSWTVTSPCAKRDLSLLAIGGGVAAIGCDDGRGIGDKPILLELATRRWRQIPGIDVLWAMYGSDPTDGVRFPDVGRHWLHVTAAGQQLDNDYWLNWHTGERSPERRDGALYDDDSADLEMPSCEARGFLPVAGEGRLALGFSADRLALRDCAQGGVVRLDEGARLVTDRQLAGGVVSWRSNVARLYLPRCGVRLTWPEPTTSWANSGRSLWRAVGGTIERAPRPGCAQAVGVVAGNRGRTVVPRPVAGSWPSALGSEAELLAAAAARPRLEVAAGSAIAIRTTQRARSVRWRLGSGGWHGASRAGRGWRLPAPRQLHGTRTLTLAVSYDRSSRTTAELQLRGRR